MIRKALLLKLLDAAYMQRWNDRIRPVDLIELDKQAHKMIVAYFLARVEEEGGAPVQWPRLVEAGIFELLQRIVITDLKPQIYYKIKADAKKYRQLNDWVYGELRPVISPLGKAFVRRYQDHFLGEEEAVERRILDAAHYYATRWEFRIIERADPGGYEIEDIRKDLDAKIAKFGDLKGMGLLGAERRYRNFIDLCGQLRFQSRWAHLHRIPKTSVLGHSLYVAILSYLFSLEIRACPRRCVNNFLTGLFHDLPEVLTRDIISPVKRSVEGLNDLIKGYEKEMLDKEVYGLLPAGWHAEFAMFAEHEFENFVTVDGQTVTVMAAELQERYNDDAYNPRDGELIKRADNLAAFVEAYAGIRNGSTSQDLQYAKVKIRAQEQVTHYAGLNFGEIYSDFD
jgi:putative hydrolase of HD superfamily